MTLHTYPGDHRFGGDGTAPKAVNDAYTAYCVAADAHEDVNKRIRELNRAEFQHGGGCMTCMGSGRCLASYSDDGGDFCAKTEDLGPCKSCKGETIPYGGDGPQHPHDWQALTQAKEDYDLARDTLESTTRMWFLKPGVEVEVYKGRKVPKGTRGTVIGIYEGAVYSHARYGHSVRPVPQRVGIRVIGEEKPVYTSIENLRVIAPSADDVDGLPNLDGSDRQVAWANKLRREAITQGRVTIDDARNHPQWRYARNWIDNRPGAERAA